MIISEKTQFYTTEIEAYCLAMSLEQHGQAFNCKANFHFASPVTHRRGKVFAIVHKVLHIHGDPSGQQLFLLTLI